MRWYTNRLAVLLSPRRIVAFLLCTADHKYSNVLEPISNPEDVTISPNEHAVIPIQSQIYAENAVTGIL